MDFKQGGYVSVFYSFPNQEHVVSIVQDVFAEHDEIGIGVVDFSCYEINAVLPFLVRESFYGERNELYFHLKVYCLLGKIEDFFEILIRKNSSKVEGDEGNPHTPDGVIFVFAKVQTMFKMVVKMFQNILI